jgi:hypothetical protein
MEDDPLKFGLTPTVRTVIKNVPAEELDRLLRDAYPQLFLSEEERRNHAIQLIEELNAIEPPKPLISIEEALRRTREDDFPDE